MHNKTLISLTMAALLSLPIGSPKAGANSLARPAYGKEVGVSIMGAIVSKDTSKSVVLLKEKQSGKVKAHKIGHKILEKYQIVAISKNYISVLKGSETLKVYKDKFAGEAIAKAKTSSSSSGSAGKYFKEDGFERKDDGTSSIDIKMTEAYRDNIVKNQLQDILMQATALPYYEEGKIVGFQLSQIDNDSVFAKGGFQDKDVITSVNGIELNSISGAIKLLRSLKQEGSINVEMMRDGTKRDMTISVN